MTVPVLPRSVRDVAVAHGSPLRSLVRSAIPYALPAFPLLLFLFVASHDLMLPGLYGDEAFPLAPAIAFVKNPADRPVYGVATTRVAIAHRSLDLMLLRYYGALKTILFIPVTAIFGASVVVVRSFALIIAAGAILAVYRFAATAFSRSAAVVSALLLALDQSFIFRTRIDWGPNALAITLTMLSIVSLMRWQRSKRRLYLVGGACTLGIALYNKTDFSYMLAALALATLVVYQAEIRRALSIGNLAVFSGSFGLGAAIFLWYNLRWPLAGFRDGNPGHIRWWQPAVYGAALYERWQRMLELLNGTSLNAAFGFFPADVRPFSFGGLLAIAFICALAIAPITIALHRRGNNPPERALAWVFLVIVLFFFFCAAAPVATSPHHVMNLYPFPHILVGAIFTHGVGILTRPLRRSLRSASLIISALLISSVIAADIAVLRTSYRMLETTGGARQWSDAIYSLAADLRGRPQGAHIHMMDWGLRAQADVLLASDSEGIDEPWPKLLDATQAPMVAQALLDDGEAEYVIFAPGAALFPAAWSTLQQYAAQHDRVAQIVKTYNGRDGIPTIQRYAFAPSPLSPAAPPAATGAAPNFSVLTATPIRRANGPPVTFITWSSGDRSICRIYVTWPGQPELLFTEGDNGAAPAQFMQPGMPYTFRLYAGTDHQRLLRELTVDAGDG